MTEPSEAAKAVYPVRHPEPYPAFLAGPKVPEALQGAFDKGAEHGHDEAMLSIFHPSNCEACGHRSDCATHNAPAMPVGPCSCGHVQIAFGAVTPEELADVLAAWSPSGCAGASLGRNGLTTGPLLADNILELARFILDRYTATEPSASPDGDAAFRAYTAALPEGVYPIDSPVLHHAFASGWDARRRHDLAQKTAPEGQNTPEEGEDELIDLPIPGAGGGHLRLPKSLLGKVQFFRLRERSVQTLDWPKGKVLRTPDRIVEWDGEDHGRLTRNAHVHVGGYCVKNRFDVVCGSPRMIWPEAVAKTREREKAGPAHGEGWAPAFYSPAVMNPGGLADQERGDLVAELRAQGWSHASDAKEEPDGLAIDVVARRLYLEAVVPLLGSVASSVFEERYSWEAIPEAAREAWRMKARAHVVHLGLGWAVRG